MNKLAVFLLVLGLTSIADASNVGKIMQLSVNGIVADEYFADAPLEASDTVTLDIMLADGFAMDAMELELEVIGPATISPPDPIFIPPWPPIEIIPRDPQHILIVGVWFGSVDGKIVDFITLHCEGEGDVVAQLNSIGVNHIVAPEDRLLTAADLGSIVIHQVPEPMTISLLGLGSLLLLRRRK